MRPRVVCAVAACLLSMSLEAPLPGAPECKLDPRHVDAARGSAGCLLVAGDRLLVIRHRNGGKLGIPGGRAEGDESAQCTAHRETWEETGLDVEVGALLKVFDNSFRLYACRSAEALRSGPLRVPRQGLGEVTGVAWMRSSDVLVTDWRFPRYFDETKSLVANAR